MENITKGTMLGVPPDKQTSILDETGACLAYANHILDIIEKNDKIIYLLHIYDACYKFSIANPSNDLQKEVQQQEANLIQMGISQEAIKSIQNNDITNFFKKENNIKPSIDFSTQKNIFMPLPEEVIYKFIKNWFIHEMTEFMYSGDKQRLADYLTRYVIPEKLRVIFNKKDISQAQKDKIYAMVQEIITTI